MPEKTKSQVNTAVC